MSSSRAVVVDQNLSTAATWSHRLRGIVPYVIGGVLFVLAAYVLHKMIGNFDWDDVKAEIARTGWKPFFWAIVLSGLSFVCLVGYEIYAVAWAGKRLPLYYVAMASFVTQSIAHSTGFAAFVGAGVRYRFYADQGFGAVDVAKVQAFFTFTFSLGLAVLTGGILILTPSTLSKATYVPPEVWVGVGVALLVAVGFYLVWGSIKQRGITVAGHRIEAPSSRVTVIQILLGVADLSAAAAALWVLLPPELGLSLMATIALFVAAIIVGIVSNVPGGLGVFEGSMLLLIQPSDELKLPLLGSLILFRLAYYLVPLIFGAVILGGLEVARVRGWLSNVGQTTLKMVGSVAPTLFGILVGVGGVVLLLSIATPAETVRIDLLDDYVPLFIIEFAHLIASLLGALLLITARGLYRRLAGAWVMSVLALAAGAVASILKGLDYEEAIYLTIVCLLLLPCRPEFYRRSSLIDERLSRGWLVAIGIIFAAVVWVLFFAYQTVDYQHDLWWQMALDADAPRSMRGVLAAALVAGAGAFIHLLRSPPAAPHLATPEELAKARAIVERHGHASSMLAFTGDKALFFDRSGEAFVMYGVSGRSWIAMGEPVGPTERWGELLWDFHGHVDRLGGRTVFYEVGPEALPWVLDLGLRPVKIGETAHVPLKTFELTGKRRSDLRNVRNKAPRLGLTFEVLSPAQVAPELDRLQAISDAWLDLHKTREKRFSLGSFKRDYIASCPCAVVRKDGAIVAFANLWIGAHKADASVDLMRFGPDAPPGTMDFLLVEAILWAKQQGFEYFDLGMAPLSGLPDNRLASLWPRLGRAAVKRGGSFYNFQGLRAFKAKFDPEWAPSYLLYPGLALARVIPDIAALVAGGWAGIVKK